MGKTPLVRLPEDLEIFLRQLKSYPCSVDWDWKKILSILQSRSRYVGAAFSSLIEAGVYHLLYSKQSIKDSTVKCQDLHFTSFECLQVAGACFSKLFFTGLASKRSERFKTMFKITIASLLDSILASFQTAGFHEESLQPLTACKDLNITGLQNLLPSDVGSPDQKSRLRLALCRVELFSSTLRSIFDCGLPVEVPICMPFLCNVIISALSVNHCDPRFLSTDIILCWRRLFHCFSAIFFSCGTHLVPASPAIITALVYQLEWSSQYVRSQPSTHALLHRLSLYHALTSIVSSTSNFSSVVVGRLLSRILAELSGDIVTFTKLFTIANNLLSIKEKNGLLEYEVCIAISALLFVEQLFSQHSYAFKHILSDDNFFQDATDEDNSTYKIRTSLFQLHSDLLSLAKRLICLLNEPQQSIRKLCLIQPSILISTMKAVCSCEYMPRSKKFRDLLQILLRHANASVRSFAWNVYNSIFYERNLPAKNFEEWNKLTKMDSTAIKFEGSKNVADKSTETIFPLSILHTEVESSGSSVSLPVLSSRIKNLPVEEEALDFQFLGSETAIDSSCKRTVACDDKIQSKRIRLSNSNEDSDIPCTTARTNSALPQSSEPLEISELTSVETFLCAFDDTLSLH